jgi:hypothetical protein
VTGATGATGQRGYSICRKIKTSIRAQRKQVSRNQILRLAVRLKNRSGGDVDQGKWYLVLPDGVTYKGSSLPLQAAGSLRGSLLVLDPLVVYAKRSIKFTITIQIMPTASGRLVFRTFLNDPDTFCQMVSSATVRLV